MIAPPLVEVLGARWELAAAVRGVAWDERARAAGFALADGTLAIARADWQGGPAMRRRETGEVEVVPPSVTAPPIGRSRAHRGACLAVAAAPEGGFLTGGADGAWQLAEPDGSLRLLARFPGRRVTAVAAAGDARACAAGAVVEIRGAASAALHLPAAARAIALDPTGRHLAAACAAGVTLWSAENRRARLLALAAGAVPAALGWAADGTLLGGAPDGAILAWEPPWSGPPRLLARHVAAALPLAIGGVLVAAGGAGAIGCWAVAVAAIACGVAAERSRVAALAWHPARPVLAVGYDSGAVALCQPGSADMLFVTRAAGAAVTALAWAAEGSWLAFGTEAGGAGLVALPASLFRAPAGAQLESLAG
jgi:hypothetical protein